MGNEIVRTGERPAPEMLLPFSEKAILTVGDEFEEKGYQFFAECAATLEHDDPWAAEIALYVKKHFNVNEGYFDAGFGALRRILGYEAMFRHQEVRKTKKGTHRSFLTPDDLGDMKLETFYDKMKRRIMHANPSLDDKFASVVDIKMNSRTHTFWVGFVTAYLVYERVYESAVLEENPYFDSLKNVDFELN